jgi:hypothetical protein
MRCKEKRIVDTLHVLALNCNNFVFEIAYSNKKNYLKENMDSKLVFHL